MPQYRFGLQIIGKEKVSENSTYMKFFSFPTYTPARSLSIPLFIGISERVGSV